MIRVVKSTTQEIYIVKNEYNDSFFINNNKDAGWEGTISIDLIWLHPNQIKLAE